MPSRRSAAATATIQVSEIRCERDDERDGRRQVGRRREPREQTRPPHRTARGADVAKAVDRERDREQQDERPAGEADRGHHQQPHQQAEGAARHRATQGGGVGPAYAVQDLERAAEGEEHADALQRVLGVAERSQQREHRENGHRDGERRDRRRLPAASYRRESVGSHRPTFIRDSSGMLRSSSCAGRPGRSGRSRRSGRAPGRSAGRCGRPAPT